MTQSEDDPTDANATATPEQIALAAVALSVGQPVPVTPPAPDMPSEFISHAAVYADETQTKLQSTRSNIAILRTQAKGADDKHKQMVDDLEAKHATAMAELDRRIADLEEVADMAEACLSARRG